MIVSIGFPNGVCSSHLIETALRTKEGGGRERKGGEGGGWVRDTICTDGNQLHTLGTEYIFSFPLLKLDFNDEF